MSDGGMPPRTAELFADLYLERLSGEKICAWAVSALDAGFDTESTRILAGMSLDRLSSFFEARPYFMMALDELKIAMPSTREDALRAYARSVAQDMVAGRMAIETALNEIHSTAREFARRWLDGTTKHAA